MSEQPTIDEILSWVSVATAPVPEGVDERIQQALCAIFEQVRASEYMTGTIAEWLVVKRNLELQAIQVFVERVEKRQMEFLGINIYDAIRDELAAMEKEADEK